MPLFSVVIPVKKGKYFLEKAINSVLNQTFQDFEIIVLTDNTTNEDGTLDWLQTTKLANLKIITSEQNLGIAENWDRILRIEKAEYFTILGYDDILYPGYLQTIADLINAHPGASLYQTQFDFIDDRDGKIGEAPFMEERLPGIGFLKTVLKSEYFIMASGYMMRSIDYDKVEGMPTQYPNLLYADYELWLRLTFLSYQVVSPRKCFAFRIHQSTTKVSSETAMLEAFHQLVLYLKELERDEESRMVIKEHGAYFLQYNCNAIAYRMIRKKAEQRQGMTVTNLIQTFEGFARELEIDTKGLFTVKNLRIASMIDSNWLTRNGYLLFKKLVKKPVMNTSFD